MRMRIVVMVGMMALLLLTLAPGFARAHGEAEVSAQPLTSRPDDVVTVKGESLGSNSEVEIKLIGDGVNMDLGEAKADEEGDFGAEFRLPADLKPGTYQLVATGEEAATTQITVEGGPAGAANSESAPMEQQEPVLRQRPLGENIVLVAFFCVLAALGFFFAKWGDAFLKARARRSS